MNRAPSAQAAEGPARRFGREITQAVSAGAGSDELTLRLTLMDASKIKRDREIALDSISFSPEGMRFLGVRVVEGGVRSSELLAGALPPEEEPAAIQAAKGQKKSNKEVRKPKAEKAKPVAAGKDFLTPPGKAKS